MAYEEQATQNHQPKPQAGDQSMARSDESTAYESTAYESTAYESSNYGTTEYAATGDNADDYAAAERIAQEERARKRVAIGLEPARATAKTELQRPPGEASAAWTSTWISLWRLRWLAFLLGLVGLATALLVLATLLDWPTSWPAVRSALRAGLNGESSSAFAAYELNEEGEWRRLVEVDFSTRGGLAEESLTDQYRIWTDAEVGAYRMRIWPDNMAWSVLGKSCLGPYRVETSAAIAANSPTAYSGLLGRFQNTRNFYMFVVDGRGNYRVLAQIDGQWSTLQPWTPSPAINPAGTANTLALQDDGRTLNFLSNETLLFGVSDLALPAGNTGLIGGARQEIAELVFDWLRLYDLPCRVR